MATECPSDDVVTQALAGRVLASRLMLYGIGFLTAITAAITSTFVARSRLELEPDDDGPTTEQPAQIDQRLERIEAA